MNSSLVAQPNGCRLLVAPQKQNAGHPNGHPAFSVLSGVRRLGRRSVFLQEPVLPYFNTAFFIHSVETDFGLTIGEPMALLTIACEHIPMARDTLKSTV